MIAHSFAVGAIWKSPVTQTPPATPLGRGTHESPPAQSLVTWQASPLRDWRVVSSFEQPEAMTAAMGRSVQRIVIVR